MNSFVNFATITSCLSLTTALPFDVDVAGNERENVRVFFNLQNRNS